MKALSLLLLRISTGIYLLLWGLLKLQASDTAVSISNKYYFGLISGDVVNTGLGVLQIAVGLAVMLGLFRNISYVAQLVWYVLGLLPIMAYILDPFGLYLVEAPKLTFFPSTTLLFASIVLIAFREYDTMSLDSKRRK